MAARYTWSSGDGEGTTVAMIVQVTTLCEMLGIDMIRPPKDPIQEGIRYENSMEEASEMSGPLEATPPS